MKIVSVRENKELAPLAVKYFQEKWAEENSLMLYEDCIMNCLDFINPLPQWYLLYINDEIAGCAGIITNDFISRTDLYPWFCSLFIEEKFRGNSYGSLLLEKARQDAGLMEFEYLYLTTDIVGYYERFGWKFLGTGYHPWGESSRIYRAKTV